MYSLVNELEQPSVRINGNRHLGVCDQAVVGVDSSAYNRPLAKGLGGAATAVLVGNKVDAARKGASAVDDIIDAATDATKAGKTVENCPSPNNLADDLVSSSQCPSRPGSTTTRGEQSLQKKIDRGDESFGTEKSQTAAEQGIRDVLKDAQSAHSRSNGVDIRDSQGRGVRITEGNFDTLLAPP